MSPDRTGKILDAAYQCFTRHGIRRTTMDDIAAAAGMSRPAVYQYVRNKDDAFRRLAARLFDGALADARDAAHPEHRAPGHRDVPRRLHGILAAKLELTLRLYHDSPHAAELLSAGALITDLNDAFTAGIRDLVIEALAGTGVADPGGLADLALALTRGLEADLREPDVPRRRLRDGLALLLAGATRPGPPALPS